jgi:hypothetical protein
MANSPKCPVGLSLAGRLFWKRLQADYEIQDAGGLTLLEQAARAFDLVQTCEAAVKRKGTIFTDRFGQPRQAPWMLNLRDSRNMLVKCLRALNLDVETGRE